MRLAWKVMVREKHGSVTFHVRDRASGRSVEVPPRRYLTAKQEREMAAQPDLILALARRIGRDLGDVEVRAEAWVSLNGRPAQLLVDPARDLTRVDDDLGPKRGFSLGPPVNRWSLSVLLSPPPPSPTTALRQPGRPRRPSTSSSDCRRRLVARGGQGRARTLEHDDVHKVLATVPGCTPREDGYGLRPKSACAARPRSAAPRSRSSRTTCSSRPAPYSAPRRTTSRS